MQMPATIRSFFKLVRIILICKVSTERFLLTLCLISHRQRGKMAFSKIFIRKLIFDLLLADWFVDVDTYLQFTIISNKIKSIIQHLTPTINDINDIVKKYLNTTSSQINWGWVWRIWLYTYPPPSELLWTIPSGISLKTILDYLIQLSLTVLNK